MTKTLPLGACGVNYVIRVLLVHHRKIAGSTSALGQSRRFARAGGMSVLTPIATEIAIFVHVG